MSFVELNGLRYRVQERGCGPPLLLLHGFTGSIENWEPVLPVLGGHFRVVALDLPGHGQTDAPDDPARYGMEVVTRDLVALLDRLAPDGVHLLGYSMGGRLALYFALNYPERVRKLVLESASPGLASESERAARRRQDARLASEIESGGIAAFVEGWEALPLFASQKELPETVQLAHRKLRLHNRPGGLANSLRGMGTGTQPDLWPRLAELEIPTLLLAGTRDPKFVEIAEQMKQTIPAAEMIVFPNAGHTVHLEQPEAYVERLLRWLR